MSIWFVINLFILLFAIWKITSGDYINLPIIFGGLGLLFILYNWTRHAFFSSIRSNISRDLKIKLATISKKVLPFHKWTGTLSLILIVLHFCFVVYNYGFTLQSSKMLSGLLAIIALFLMVTTGWIRFFKTTYHIRLVHLISGFYLIISVFIHLVL